MTKYLTITFSLLIISCASINVEDTLNQSTAGRQQEIIEGVSAFIEIPQPEVIVVERHIFIPQEPLPPPRPAAGRPTVQAAIKSGVIKPSEFSHAAIIFDFHPDWVYEVFTRPLRVTNIHLEPGERVLEAPFVSDSERWQIGAGVSFSNGVPVQHIYVRPDIAGISATLIINTDRRVYHIILRSFSDIHMPIVRWRYPPLLPQNFLPPPAAAGVLAGSGTEDTLAFAGADPRFMSFNYRITFSRFRRPPWLPTLVFDDGSRTFITFPQNVLQRELPAVFENRRDIVNYRVMGNVIVIDQLIENLTLRLDNREVSISKLRGSNARTRR